LGSTNNMAAQLGDDKRSSGKVGGMG